MKKLLLTLAAAVLGMSAYAAELTIPATNETTWTKSGDDYTATVDGFNITMAKAGSTNALVAPDATAARVYQGATLTITAPAGTKMTKVTFTEVHNTATELSHATFSEGWTAFGKLTSSKTAEEFGATSAGLDQIVMTAGKQLRISNIVIEYSTSAVQKEDPKMSFPESAYTVILGETFTAPTLTKATDAAAVYTSSNEDVAKVDASTGAITIEGTGSTTIQAKAEENDTYYEGKASYTLTVIKACNSVAELYTLAPNTTGLVNFDLTVAYVNGSNVYCTTGSEWTLIFGYNLKYVAGDVIPAGWEGTFAPYGGMPEIKPASTMPEVKETGKAVNFAEATEVNLDMINHVVVLKNVDFEAATPAEKENFTGKTGDTEISFRNNFLTASVEAGIYDVTCAIGYSEKDATEATDESKIQVYPISYEKISTGIATVEADENAPVEYYNLQGVRVANPESGLYIRRQGSKAVKVLVK